MNSLTKTKWFIINDEIMNLKELSFFFEFWPQIIIKQLYFSQFTSIKYYFDNTITHHQQLILFNIIISQQFSSIFKVSQHFMKHILKHFYVIEIVIYLRYGIILLKKKFRSLNAGNHDNNNHEMLWNIKNLQIQKLKKLVETWIQHSNSLTLKWIIYLMNFTNF